MRIYTPLLLCLCSVLTLSACGDEPNTIIDNDPGTRTEVEAGVPIPDTGVVLIQVNPNRPYPECLYPPGIDAAYLLNIAETTFHAITNDLDSGAALYYQPAGSGNQLRFWVLDETVSAEEDVTLSAEIIADQFLARMDETFSEYWDIDLAGYTELCDVAITAREAAQVELRRFREARRGLPDTPESRRELAQLDHAVNARNDEVGELQKKMRAITEDRERGQRVFRRINR